MAGLSFEIVKHIAVISENAKGWKKEVNIISWNNRKPKIDIRDWDPDHQKMGKGITLTLEEFMDFKDVLEEIDVAELGIE